ncbi:MAG TPA: integrase [Ruminococcaceae bacterium]|nr:integrase [Oscillospiraceae bacterium]
MRSSDFSKMLGSFLSVYLPSERNFSKNTISSYCDTFKLLLQYIKATKGLSPEKVTVKFLNREFILLFLNWLEQERGCSVSTVNQRLAGIHSFFRYIQIDYPDLLLECQKILSIPFRKKPAPAVNYLNATDLRLILEQPDCSTRSGRRDLTLLSLLYDTGGRVQEIADLTVGSLRLQAPAQIMLVGKGNKSRAVPLMAPTVQLLEGYLFENRLNDPNSMAYPLFRNQRKEPLTRAGICYILKKYAAEARAANPHIPQNITPHVFRHSKAMHLLEAGVNIIYIRDILGHVDVSTTEVYAKANMEMKRAALEKVSHISVGNVPSWATNSDLLSWLNDFGKSLS